MPHEDHQPAEAIDGGHAELGAPAASPLAPTPSFGWSASRAPALSPAMALQLQAGAGNAAVAALIARQAAPATPADAAPAAGAAPTAPAPAPAPAPSAPGGAEGAPAAEQEVDPALEFIAGYARRVPGYNLLTHAIGADPITGARVGGEGSLLREVIGLVPGGAELMQRLQQSGAIDRAGAWLRQEIPTLGLSYEAISSLFSRAWDSISAWDLLDPSAAWDRLSAIFTPPIDRVIAFAERAAEKLFEFSLEAMIAAGGGASEQVLGVLRRAGEAFGAIVRDPMGFARNLVAAVRGGFERFAENIGTHLQQGLLGWLTGALRGAIRLPARLDFEGIVDLATQVLGLTWDRIRERLVRMIGPRQVAFLERTVDFVRDIADRGLGAAWEKIKEFASGLADQVFDAIRNWIAESVIGQAIRRLATMFNPVGAIVNFVIGIYDTIQFIVERARQIGDLVDAVTTSITEIASGAIGRAVDAVENALSRALPVAISFLAELIGLDNVGERVRETIERLRETVDSAIDRMLDWIVSRFRGGGDEGEAEGDEATDAGAEPGTEPAAEEPDVTFDAAGEHHRLWVDHNMDPPRLFVASTPTQMRDLLEHWGRLLGDPDELGLSEQQQDRARADLAQATALVDREEAERRGAQARRVAEERDRGRRLVVRDSTNLVSATEVQRAGPDEDLTALRVLLERLFETFRRDEAPETDDEREAPFRCSARITVRRPRAHAGGTENLPAFRGRSGGRVTRPAVAESEEPEEAEEAEEARDPEVVIQSRTWATGVTGPRESNPSHGERHLSEWIDDEAARDSEFLGNVVAIELENDPFSPCAACTDVLKGLIAKLPNVRVATLSWAEAYYPEGGGNAPNATRVYHIEDLVSAGWVVQPGAAVFARMAAELEQRPRRARR